MANLSFIRSHVHVHGGPASPDVEEHKGELVPVEGVVHLVDEALQLAVVARPPVDKVKLPVGGRPALPVPAGRDKAADGHIWTTLGPQIRFLWMLGTLQCFMYVKVSDRWCKSVFFQQRLILNYFKLKRYFLPLFNL